MKKNVKKNKLSRQDTPNSVRGVYKQIMYYNVDDDANVADDVDDDDDDDDDDDERKMMMWMFRTRRRRKMMMLRRMMLRRKTDPKTGKHTLCEPKRTRTFHKSHFVEIYRKSAVRQARDTRFVRACAVEMHMDMSEEAFVRKLTRKMPDASPAASVLCEPAQSKCTWTCHKRHFVRKFTGKMPNAPDTTSIEHRALTPTVRTPHCGHTVWGIIWNNMYVCVRCFEDVPSSNMRNHGKARDRDG